MQAKAPAKMPLALQMGIQHAVSDDGRIGPNDVKALKALALQQGRPDLADVLEESAEPFSPRKRRQTRRSSGYALRVVDFKPGTGSDFNQDQLGLALGRPEGAGDAMGSLDVVSLGKGGQITLQLGRPVTRGVKVFENPFSAGGGVANPEPAQVEVSADGATWFTMKGQAGLNPVFLNSQNMLNPRSLDAGGDNFSFKKAGVPEGTQIEFVRITDSGSNFDLDGVYGY